MRKSVDFTDEQMEVIKRFKEYWEKEHGVRISDSEVFRIIVKLGFEKLQEKYQF